MSISCKINLNVNATRPYWSLVNNTSGNGLVPSGNKLLCEPMFIQVYGHELKSEQWQKDDILTPECVLRLT